MKVGAMHSLSTYTLDYSWLEIANDRDYRWTEQKSEDVTDYVMGQYVTDKKAGIRTHPYSTSESADLSSIYYMRSDRIFSRDINPLRYSSVGTLNEVHST